MSNNAVEPDRNDIFGPSIAFKPIFLNVDGSPTTALFLSQAYWWQKQANSGSGFGHNDEHGRTWFWKTQADFEQVTGLSRHYQRKAREKLRDMPWYEEKQLGMPAKLHFHIDVKNLKAWAMAHDPDVDMSEHDPQTSDGHSLEQGRGGSSDKGEEGPRTDAPAHNAGASRSKTTTKTTTETTDSSAERTPTPEDHEPDTSEPDTSEPTDDDLRDLVERKVRAACQMANYSVTDDRLDQITADIRDSDLPDDAHRDYVRAEVSRIKSARRLVEWLGGDKSVEGFLERSPDYEPDVSRSERLNSSSGTRVKHHDEGDRLTDRMSRKADQTPDFIDDEEVVL